MTEGVITQVHFIRIYSSLLTFSSILGLLPVAVVNRLGSRFYMFVLLLMLLMAVTSTGSAEVVAIASILVYDIHMVYLKVTLIPPGTPGQERCFRNLFRVQNFLPRPQKIF